MHANPIEDLVLEGTRERYRAYRRCLHLYCTDPVRWNTLCQEHGVLPPNVLAFTKNLLLGIRRIAERVYDMYPVHYCERIDRIREQYPLDDALLNLAVSNDVPAYRAHLNQSNP